MRTRAARRQHLRQLLDFGLGDRRTKVDDRRTDQLLRDVVAWRALPVKSADDMMSAALLLAAFLRERCRRDLDSLDTLRSLFKDYARQLERAETDADRYERIIAFAAALGAGRRQVRRYRRAGRDIGADRYRCRTGEIEQQLVFSALRYGNVVAAVLSNVPFAIGEARRLWVDLDLEVVLDRLMRYEGDPRVRGAAFEALSAAVSPLPADSREAVVGERMLRQVYRAALDHRQDPWVQCRALETLQGLSNTGFATVADRRLARPSGRDGSLARRRIVQLIGRSGGDTVARVPVLAMACADPSPDVRLAVVEILPGLPRAMAAPLLARLARVDRARQVRAAALLSILGNLGDDERREDAAVLLADVCRSEADGSVLLTACRVIAEGAERLEALSVEFSQSWTERLVPYLKIAQARALGEATLAAGRSEGRSADLRASGEPTWRRRADAAARWRRIIVFLPNAVAAMRRRRNPNLIYRDLEARRITAQEAARELRDRARRRRRLSQAASS